jgi:hypothetical protein
MKRDNLAYVADKTVLHMSKQRSVETVRSPIILNYGRCNFPQSLKEMHEY